jgi:conjugal transfer ATP-binding protein TraC
MSFFNLLFGSDGGMTNKELEKFTRRVKFSDYLPYVAYDQKEELYYNNDDTIGYIFECDPLSFAGESTADTLKGLFRIGLPENSVVQFILYADPRITPILNSFKAFKKRKLNIIEAATDNFISFLKKASEEGLKEVSNIPVRCHRLFISVKIPLAKAKNLSLQEIKHNIQEILSGAGLPPASVKPGVLLDTLRRIFNDHISENNDLYDEHISIRKQIILSDTVIKTGMNHIKIGKKYFRCITPKIFPKEIDVFLANQLTGGVWGVVSDADQIKTPFIYTMNVVVKNLKTELHAKCSLLLQQQGFGSLAPSLRRKKEEYLWATDKVDGETQFLHTIPSLWVWDEDEQQASRSILRVKRMWESHGFVMQEDKGILPILFISCLPFGLYADRGNIQKIDRDFIVPDDMASTIAPIQGDYGGGGSPYTLFVGRKGQLAVLDLFDEHSDNYNALITASTGAGKSFAVNYLVFNHFAAGDKIRIIDIGGSYKKLVNMFNGKFLEFNAESNINLNPFTNIKEFESGSTVISAIIRQMVLSSTGQLSTDVAETASTLIKSAVSWAYSQEANQADINTVYRYLKKYSDFVDKTISNKEHFINTASMLAFNLKDFTSDGVYGRWFNGKSNFNIGNDDFVLLELEDLKPQKELFKVVTLQVINAVTRDLYLSDRSSKRLIVFDEAWQFLEESGTFKDVIEEGYRRARKYRGSFTVVVQSLLDLKSFGPVGDVISGNSAYKFFLASPDFEKAKQEKIIDYDDFTMRMLKTVKSNKPKYSEIFVDSPFGVGVVRLIVDPYSYYIYTSDAKEVSEIQQLVKEKGVDYAKAIEYMVKKYRS